MATKSAAFNIGFDAGQRDGNWLAESVEAVGMAIQSFDLTPGTYKAMRADWIKGYMAGLGCTEKRAENAWAGVWQGVELTYGYKKPQTEAAAKKAAQRAKSAPAKADKSQTAGNVAAPVKGTDAAKAVKFELRGIEAHLIDLFRRGQFKAMIDILHSEAEKAAPM